MYILDGVKRGLRISIDNSIDTVQVTNTEAEAIRARKFIRHSL